MAGPGADRITLDRTNLLRLCEVLDQAEVQEHPVIGPGWRACVNAIRELSIEMPHLYGNEGYQRPS